MKTMFKEPLILDDDELDGAQEALVADPEKHLRAAAYHEAGHIVVAFWQRGSIRGSVTIGPGVGRVYVETAPRIFCGLGCCRRAGP